MQGTEVAADIRGGMENIGTYGRASGKTKVTDIGGPVQAVPPGEHMCPLKCILSRSRIL